VELIWALSGYANPVGTGKSQDQTLNRIEKVEEIMDKNEPVAWQWLGSAHFRKKIPKNADKTAWNPLYHYSPPQTWAGLTDEDISEIVRGTHNTGSFVRAIEAKLKEKNT
jgi:hypothetical protein